MEVVKDLGKRGEMKEMVRERWSFDRISAINGRRFGHSLLKIERRVAFCEEGAHFMHTNNL